MGLFLTLRIRLSSLRAVAFIFILAEGNSFSQEMSPAQTAELCERKLLSTPYDSAVWAGLVAARIEMSDWIRAAEAVRIWRRNMAKKKLVKPEIDLDLGLIEWNQDRVAEAAVAWRAYTRAVPKSGEGWGLLADAEKFLGNLPAALAASAKELALNDTAEGRIRRAEVFILQRNWRKAGVDVEAANKLDPTNQSVQSFYPLFEREKEWLAEIERLDANISTATKVEDKLQLLLERVEKLAAQNLAVQALEDARQACVLAPESFRASLWALACKNAVPTEAEYGVGEFGLTLAKLLAKREALLKLDAAEREIQASFLLELGAFTLAFEHVEKNLGSLVRIEVIEKRGGTSAARKAVQKALQLDLSRADLWLKLSGYEIREGNFEQALHCAQKLLALGMREQSESIRATVNARKGTR